MGYHYTMGAELRYQIVKEQSEHRARIELASPRYDGGIFPLDEQCFGLCWRRLHPPPMRGSDAFDHQVPPAGCHPLE